MTLEQQLAVWDRFAAGAYEMALDSMAANYHRIVTMARARLVEGYPLHGDAMFTATTEQLHQEALEEYADACNYWVARMWQTEFK